MECFAVVQLVVIDSEHLLRNRAVMVIARVGEVLSSSLGNALVTVFLL